MIKVSDYIAQRLKAFYDIDLFFMISGGGAMHLNDSLGQYIPYVCNHHEQASAIAAEGYARVSGKLAVVNVTTGPGGLNCLNGVFGQWTDSVPVLYLSGQVKYSTTIASCPTLRLRQLGDQEVNIISVVQPLTKYAVMVTDPISIKFHLDKAIHAATTGRKGPVWLDIPMNVQNALVDEADLEDFLPPTIDMPACDYPALIDRIANAARPIIVAGHGIRLAQQQQTLKKVVALTGIPVVTTFNGFDLLDEVHPNYIGRIGSIGQRAGNFALQNADLVLCLGTRNNIRQVSYNYENFAAKAVKIVVDIDLAELQKPTLKPDVAIHADLKNFLPDLLDALALQQATRNWPDRFHPWLQWCSERKTKYKHPMDNPSTSADIDPYYFSLLLSKMMDENTVMVMANGSACVCPFQSAQVRQGQRYLLNSGDASMGYELPAAIGACLAQNRKSTVCLAGDGSIMMNLQELQTIRHENLPIKIFILNNRGYSSIKQTQQNFFSGRLTGADRSSGVSFPDFISIGQSFGIKSLRLDNHTLVDTTLREIIADPEPVLCEIMIEQDYIFSPKLSSKTLDDGRIVSPSLEDMYPFLSKEEMAENTVQKVSP